MVNHKITKCRNFAEKKKEYKTRHDSLEEMIHRILCKKLKFDHTIKWYVLNPESALANEHNILWNFGIQTDHVFLARRHDLVILFTNPSARAGYDTRSFFTRGLTGLNSEFSFSYTSCLSKAEEIVCPTIYP